MSSKQVVVKALKLESQTVIWFACHIFNICVTHKQNANASQAMLMESAILHSCHHNSIVSLCGIVSDVYVYHLAISTAHIFMYRCPPELILEYVSGGDLHAWLRQHGPPTPSVVCSIALQVASALDYIHQLGVLHRDVAARNCLIEQGSSGQPSVVKLSDFGCMSTLQQHAFTLTLLCFFVQ